MFHKTFSQRVRISLLSKFLKLSLKICKWIGAKTLTAVRAARSFMLVKGTSCLIIGILFGKWRWYKSGTCASLPVMDHWESIQSEIYVFDRSLQILFISVSRRIVGIQILCLSWLSKVISLQIRSLSLLLSSVWFLSCNKRFESISLNLWI